MPAMSEAKKKPRELWHDYAFLTRELIKFTGKQDWNLVIELITQREKLQLLIEAAPDDGYKSSLEGREIMQTIRSQNHAITAGLQRIYNTAQRSQQVSRAYEQTASHYSSSFMDRQS